MGSPFLHKPILIVGDIKLRPFTGADSERMCEILKDPEMLFLTGSVDNTVALKNPTIDLKQVTEWYGALAVADNRLDLAIEYKGTVAGELVINEYDNKNSLANFRVLMDSQYTSKGIGFQSIQLFLNYVKENLPIKTITLEVFEFNERAKHVYEKVGFVFEYREEQAHVFDGKVYATDHYFLNKENRQEEEHGKGI